MHKKEISVTLHRLNLCKIYAILITINKNKELIPMDYVINENWNNTKDELNLFRELDKGINDMEAGRELPLEDAFRKITELREQRRSEKA